MEPTLKGVLVSMLTGIVAAIAAILFLYLPILNMLVLVFPIPFIIVGVKKDITHGLLALAAATAVLCLLIDTMAGVYLLALTLLPVGGIVYALKKRLDFFESSMLASVSVLVSIFLFLQVFSSATGHSLFDMIWQSFNVFFVDGAIDFGGILKTYHGLGYFKNFTSEQQLAQFFINEMKLYVPYTIIMMSVVLGVVLYLISRYAIKRMGYNVVSVPRFKLWYLPGGMGIGLLVLLIVGLIGQQTSMGIFSSVLLTIRMIISFIFSLMGMSVVWFFLDTPRIHIALRWVIAVLVALLFSFSMGLALVGMIDHIFNLRRIQKVRFSAKK